MSNLTADQVRKIEENKKIALQKRQNAKNVGHGTVTCAPQQHLVNLQTKSVPKKVDKAKTVMSGKSGALKQGTIIFKLLSSSKFAVEMTFHEQAIEIMKTIPGRVFDKNSKLWSFPIVEHDNVLSKLSVMKSHVVTPLPKNVVQCLNAPEVDVNNVDISKVEPVLRAVLLPFQVEGVKFGVSRKGRCLIADDMGLGKTLQALGIAHYFIESWPMLIVCPSSMRFPWEEAILRFLPSIDPFSITVLTAATDCIFNANIVISSYDLLKTCLQELKKKKFRLIIFDESHSLKTQKSGRTKAALELTPLAKHVILLSGTPALSRPLELYPQIYAIDPSCFPKFYDFGLRYCDGKKNRFGWDYSGSSNSAELEILMKKKFMLRRMKADVQLQLPSKVRKVVVLHPTLVHAVSKQMTTLASQVERQRGMDRRGALLEYYCATGIAKLPAVKEYLADKLETPGKMLVFAHHSSVLDGIVDMLEVKRIDYIRIDGTTSAESRALLCERFQAEPDVRVAVLSIKAANSGITLTAAQLVLFAELYWNPGELTQAEDRAHRIGQRDSVCIEYLIAKGTADDNLWSLVESKLQVLNAVGLSKDSFRNVGTEHLPDKHQPLITDMLENVKREESGDLSASQANLIVDVDFDSLEEAFTEDDVFNCVDLENIEDEYCSKRQKLAL